MYSFSAGFSFNRQTFFLRGHHRGCVNYVYVECECQRDAYRDYHSNLGFFRLAIIFAHREVTCSSRETTPSRIPFSIFAPFSVLPKL